MVKQPRKGKCGSEGAVLLEALGVIPLVIFLALWTFSYLQTTRELAVALDLSAQAAVLAMKHCSDPEVFDRSLSQYPNETLIDSGSSGVQALYKMRSNGGVMNCLDQVKLLLEAQRETRALPYYEVAIQVWRGFPADSPTAYTRCFRYPMSAEEGGSLIPVTDDGVCEGAQVKMLSTVAGAGTGDADWNFEQSKALVVRNDYHGDAFDSPAIASKNYVEWHGSQGKLFRVEAKVFLRSEAFAVNVADVVSGWAFGTTGEQQWVFGMTHL
jgi:hypothetical protein